MGISSFHRASREHNRVRRVELSSLSGAFSVRTMNAIRLISFTLAMTVAAAGPAFADPAAVAASSEPNWKATIVSPHARTGQPFVIDGVYVQIDRIRSVSAYADGTPPDVGARAFEVEFWMNNPLRENAELYDRFYAFAKLSDGTDTDGDGLSFFPLDSSKEITGINLKSGQAEHARFDFEVPTNAKVTSLVIFGPIDGATVTIPISPAL